jgi:hypothetical protein
MLLKSFTAEEINFVACLPRRFGHFKKVQVTAPKMIAIEAIGDEMDTLA